MGLLLTSINCLYLPCIKWYLHSNDELEKAKEVKIAEREKLKAVRKKKRTNKRKRKQEIRQAEKQKYGLNPGKKTKPESVAQIQHDVFLHDFVFEEPEEIEVSF